MDGFKNNITSIKTPEIIMLIFYIFPATTIEVQIIKKIPQR